MKTTSPDSFPRNMSEKSSTPEAGDQLELDHLGDGTLRLKKA